MKRLLLLALTLGLVLTAAVAHAGKLDEIKQRGTLVCGVKDSVVPFGFIDETSKQLVGFDVDICQFIADRAGVKLEVKTVTSATRIPMLTQGSVDLVAATMTHKFERDDVIDFSITYFDAGQRLLVKKGGGIKSAADLKGKKVATVKGSTSEKNMKAAQPDCVVVSFDEYPQAFLALKQGKAEAVTTDEPILVGLKNSDPEPDKWDIVGDFIASEPYGLGLVENDSKFRDFVNKSLAEMWTSGAYQKSYDKWFGKDTKYFIPLKWKMEVWP
ncbi:MAG TPA: amino acid ABC transporter substrate-binding protein [Desulfovibrio sp.]|nr:amino acid ABC transporter substrate-binding protein [Desulfovibrio sp.]